MSLQEVFAPVTEELGTIMQVIKASVPDGCLYELCAPFLDNPGKGIRPGLFLLCSRLVWSRPNPDKFIPIAAALELFHWSSLIHDDVIDEAVLRRGVPTINFRYGPAVAILVGDFFLSRAIHFLVGCDGDVLDTISQLFLDLVMGEIQEQLERGQYRLTETQYLQLVGRKTASFLAAACALGAKMAGACGEMVAVAKDYGYCLGMVYQLRDDLLDIVGDPAVLGKKTGVDVLAGVETLPAIRARSLLPQQYYKVVNSLSEDGDTSSLGDLLTECGALEYTESLIQVYFDRAAASLERLPAGSARDRLRQLLEYVVLRDR